MKKLISLLAVSFLLAVGNTPAANFTISSLLSPNISSLVISNGIMGATNLTYISQNFLQGVYQLGTNTAGTSINGAIATNYAAPSMYFSNSTPVQWFGQTFNGSLVVLTNAAVASTLSTNDVLYTTVTTNNPFNFFQDAPLPQDFFNTLGESGIGAATTTNSVAYLQIVSTPWSLYGSTAVGAGSNIVNVALEPLASLVSPNPGPGQYIPGFVAGMSTSFGDQVWTVTYTNQISTVGAPTVYNIPVPRWRFPGAKGVRVRYVYSGSSTNAVNIQSITLQSWVP